MNKDIKNAIENGRLILLLGAGASYNSKNRLGKNPPLGYELRRILSEDASLEIEDSDSLSDIYQATKHKLGDIATIRTLEKHYKNCESSNDYKEIIKIPFPRIYTLNIDDSFERSINETTKYKNFNVFRRNDRIEDFDSLYEQISLIKLNGDINVPDDGFIFSPSEYAEGSAQQPEWYRELANDFHRYIFLFIGTKLDEPLFNHVIEKYRLRHGISSSKSFLLTKRISSVKEESLKSKNIEFIEGDISTFSKWLRDTFPNGITPRDILKRTRPEHFSSSDNLIVVNKALLSLKSDSISGNSEIKNFYRGFKPTWQDILTGVPADLKQTLMLNEKILKSGSRLFLILGPAGSGKTTALKQIAFNLSELKKYVFYMDSIAEDLKNIVDKLESDLDDTFYIFIDRIADSAADIEYILNNGNYTKVIFIGAENIRIWKDRGEAHLDKFKAIVADYSKICNDDVDPILKKLRKFGPWTRLEKMTLEARRSEIIEKSKKQLLIGLLEATSGQGYKDIIHREYKSINEYDQKAILLLTGLATLQRSFSSESTLTRALANLGISENVENLISRMDGIISYNNGKIMTRHRIYIEELIYNFISQDELIKMIKAYIEAFSVYEFPIVVNLKNKKDSAVYKGLINFKFLKKILRDDSSILMLYHYFEKSLELEGLFLLQYGLALRASKKYKEALEKLRTARDAYSDSVHIEHAYAQQLMIMGAEENLDRQTILKYVDEAIEILKKLEHASSKNYEPDLYPIVTLSKGHIKVLHRLKDYENARKYADKYFNEISSRFPKTKDNLISDTKNFLLKYRTTGKLEKNIR